MRPHYLNPLFAPGSIAVFGASERADSVGQVVFRNLLQAGFKGTLYAVNPRHDKVQGQPCYPDLASIGEPVDLAVVGVVDTVDVDESIQDLEIPLGYSRFS